MKKRFISIFLLVTMFFTVLPTEAMAVVNENINTSSIQEKIKLDNPFADVREDNWYYDAVQYSRVNGFFSGTGSNTFTPDGTMTRGMFVTVLGQMAGVDQATYKGQSTFSDVAEDAYYAPFVVWASKYGITAGVENGRFDPDGLVTREQMAVFFVCYFEKFGVEFDTGANITTVPKDLDSVSPWAREMVLKLWKTGLLAGDGTNFNPKANASRAHAAALCMSTDKAVKTWYSEPGKPSGRVSIDPLIEQNSESQNPSTGEPGTDSNHGDNGNAGNSGGSGNGNGSGGSNIGSKTTYYKVTFVVESTEEDKPYKEEEKLYKEGTLLSTMPVPVQPPGKVFLGWYYDEEKTKAVSGGDKLNSDITLYASFTDAVKLDEGGTLNFVSVLDQGPDFTVSVKKSNSPPVLGTDFKFRNITAPERTPETEVGEEDMANIETVTVEGSNGVWTIKSANEGFTPGHTYQIELVNDAVIYDDSADAFGNLKENNERYDINQVRFFNFSIEQNGTMNLKLKDGIKYINVEDISKADGANLMEYAGLYLASTDDQGNITYTANDGSGSFTYDGGDIHVGDIVSVYSGTIPTNRKPEKGSEDKTDNGDVSYVKIINIDGSTHYYVAAEAEDVLFTPDVLPINVEEGKGTTGWTDNGTTVTVINSVLDFSSSEYEDMGLNSETTVDVGDFLVFYIGNFGEIDAQDITYGEITKIKVNENGTTTINYNLVEEKTVLSAMELYDETKLTKDEIMDSINKNKEEIQEIIEAQVMESNFFDEAGEYLAGLALQTDEVREVFGDGLTLSDCIITYADGTPLGANELTLMGNIIDNEQNGKKPKVTVSVSTLTTHFDPKLVGTGIRAEVAVNYKFKIKRQGNNNIMEVDLTAFFEQEFTFGFNVSGGAVWKWKWKIIPYIADYRMTGNLDIGTYTGLGITATAKLTQAKEEWGMPWPNSAKEAKATGKIFSLSESIKELVESARTVLPEEEATGSGGLAEKYARFMEDANEEWVDLVSVNLITLRSAVDPLHVLAFGLDVDFVVSANLNVAIGMTFQYENFKRHSFTLHLLSKKGESESIDLSTNGYQFDFYVMGTVGIRAGVRVKVTVGLFSTKLAAIGLQFETGAYVRLWGYFYYHLENWKVDGKWQKESGYSGALLIEIGAYLDVKFIAEALNGKYSYTPSIYVKEWPLWSVGQRENVYDFAYENNRTFDILNINTYTLPKTVFDMYWMDIKTGEMEEGFDNKVKNFDSNKAPNGDDEEYFAVDLSNPNFSYNPVNNQITVSTDSGEVTQSCEMKITWKGTSLSRHSEVLKRTVKLNWSNEENAGTIAFESNGGSAVPMIRLLAGTPLTGKMPTAPVRQGYTFDGWYEDSAFGTPFNATNMPEGNKTLYAKWIPNDVSYIVEHYQKALDGQYVLVKTDKDRKGKVGEQTTVFAESYTGFTAQPIKQQTIESDGSTRISVYYDRNSYDLKFVYGNGSNDVNIKVAYGAAIVKPSNPIKAGYSFADWDEEIPDIMPANNLTFTAEWTARTDTSYRVKHYKQNLDGTYKLEQTDEKYGTTGQLTDAITKTYTGFTAKTFTQKTILPDSSTVVEIYYDRVSFTLSWEVNGGNPLTGTYTSCSVKYGTTIMKPDTPTRTGYNFAGWYKDAELTSALEDNATMPAQNMTLYTRWNIGYYTINFNSNGGSIVSPITQEYGTAVSEPATPARAGYTFAGWKLNGENYIFTTMPGENITLIAQWTAHTDIPYTVEHYLEKLDGSYPSIPDETENLTGTTDSTVTANAKSNTGFTFDSGVSGTVTSGTVAADGSLVLKMYYTRNSYTVTWDGNGGEVDTNGATTGSVKYGAVIASPVNNPVRTGYTFNQWSGYTEDMAMPDEDIAFTADWTINQYTITFDSDGGSEVEAITQDYGTVVSEPEEPTKMGYSFTGWKLSGEDYIFTTMPAENITLVASWTDKPTYVVNFDANGGTVSQTYKYVFEGGTYGELPVPSNDELFFLGWYTSPSGGTKVTAKTEVELNSEHTLYACWAATGFTEKINENLELYVAGIKVTEDNMNDILGDGSGSVQYDPKDSTTYTDGRMNFAGTLYLNNATITGYTSMNYYTRKINTAIYCDGSLTIVNTGTSTVTNPFDDVSTEEDVHGMFITSKLIISGTGSLTVTSGTGGKNYNCGMRVGLRGNDFRIDGPEVTVFAGVAGSGGKSYGVFMDSIGTYAVEVRKGTLETHGYDCAGYADLSTAKYFIKNQYQQKFAIITVSENYDGSDAIDIEQDETYRDYKYIYVTNP